jgi:HNH endonuclease
MRCIFCKNDSSNSRSVEHIIPESLGNTTKILPRGVVCDACNNYFARKVEKPFLEAPALMSLRFHQAIPNKKRTVPPISGVLLPGFPITAYRYLEGSFAGMIDVPPEAVDRIVQNDGGTLLLPSGGQPPSDKIISRFLAKVAVESMAERLLNIPGGVDYIVDEAQLDTIRNHARRGDTPDWPHHSRRIYDVHEKWTDELGSEVQMVHESDILQTTWGEWFFVLAIFGLELVINYGGSEIEGYRRWLSENNGDSPLYSGKNKASSQLRRTAS